MKPFISRTKQFKRNLRHGFAERKTAEDNNAKINVFPNIPSIVNVYLKTSNERTHIALFINQFVSLAELKI